jgi:hypothetical protein
MYKYKTVILDFEKVHRLASELVASNIDHNEVSKSLSYLRSKRDPKQFFRYLRTINKNISTVIRSDQTPSYYHKLLEVCERHLQYMDYEEMSQTLGWAIRLMRYYKIVPVPEMKQALNTAISAAVRDEPKPKKRIPQDGEIFTGEILELGEDALSIRVYNHDPEQVVGILRTEHIKGGKTSNYKEGDRVRVQAIRSHILKSERIVLELKQAPKVEKA